MRSLLVSRTSYYVTEGLVERAIAELTSLVKHYMREEGNSCLAACVSVRGTGLPFNESVVYATSWWNGPVSSDGTNYEKIALSKNEVSWETGLSSREITELHPEYLQARDTVYAGSYVLGPIVVAVSGLMNQRDEMIAAVIAHMIHGEVMVAHRKMRESGVAFLPEFPSA